MKATERIYLNSEKTKAVPEGDPDGAWLWAAPGDDIPDEAAEKFGLVDGGFKKRRAAKGKNVHDPRAGNGEKGGGSQGNKSKKADDDKEKKSNGNKGGLTVNRRRS